MQKWVRLRADAIWAGWIPDARYNAETVLLWHWGQTQWTLSSTAFNPRAVLVYVPVAGTQGAEWDVLGVATTMEQLGQVSSLYWAWPPWQVRWTMPETPVDVAVNVGGDSSLPDMCAAVDAIWRRTIVHDDFCSHTIQHVLCQLTDYNRPGLGDAFHERHAEMHHDWVVSLLRDAGERTMIRCIAQWWGADFVRAAVCEPSDSDYLAYFERHTKDVPRPTIFFRVPVEQCGIRGGRIAHLDLPAWICERHLLDRRHSAQQHYTYPSYWTEQHTFICATSFNRGPSPKKSTVRAPVVPLVAAVPVAKYDKFIASAAPCVRAILRGGFPRDGTRNMLARSMIHGGYALPDIEDLFLRLNRRENPAATAEETRRRFDVSYEVKRQYPPETNCAKLASICPYTGPTVGHSCQQCHQDFSKANPQVVPQDSHRWNWGPYKWWALLH